MLGPDGGEQLRFLGASTMRIKHDGGAGGIGFYEYVSEPGVTGPPAHVHYSHDETFYVVAGEYEFTVGDEQAIVPAGGFVLVPRGTPHTFRNAGTGLGRIVGTFQPGAFTEYFRELARLIADDGQPPDHDRWAELYARYDTSFADRR